MSEPDGTAQFVSTYIAAWSTADQAERRALIGQLYAEDADFFADEPGDDAVTCRGPAEIFDNITQVNRRLTAMTGMSVLLGNRDGRIVRDYILIS